jgi:hypothetical protein
METHGNLSAVRAALERVRTLAARLRLLEEPFRVRERILRSHLVTCGPVRFTSATEAPDRVPVRAV